MTFKTPRGSKVTYTNPVEASKYIISLCKKMHKAVREEILSKVSDSITKDERCDVDFGVLRYTRA